VLALSDEQMKLLQDAAAALDSEADRKRLLELVGDACKVRDIDVIDAISRALREVRGSKKRKLGGKFGDLVLPPNCRVVTESSGIVAIVGPPYRPTK
jgi:hypothetical protein